MTPVVFMKYGVHGGPVHIIVERITHWEVMLTDKVLNRTVKF